jgi:hypothetical protein
MRDWVGRTVRTRRELRTGQVTVPTGTVATVSHAYGGLMLLGKPCEHCGIRLRMRRVPLDAVDLLPEDTS